ncbi:MAG: hypothetical protein JWO12_2941 [Frankiales bacterium]|nr:hypothetical protein [Frankiales bacterium]
MSTSEVVAVVIVAIVIVLLAASVAAASRKRRTNRLREDFGPEYDRTLEDAGKRRDAEKELAARKDEHGQLQLRPLSVATRQRYTQSWTALQAKFVDAPALAVSEADALVTALMAERGYPTDSFDEQSRLLSVEHGHVLDSYRAAHEIELASRAGQASTEAVRNAMLDFRRVFEDVMGDVDEVKAEPYPNDEPRATAVREDRPAR